MADPVRVDEEGLSLDALKAAFPSKKETAAALKQSAPKRPTDIASPSLRDLSPAGIKNQLAVRAAERQQLVDSEGKGLTPAGKRDLALFAGATALQIGAGPLGMAGMALLTLVSF